MYFRGVSGCYGEKDSVKTGQIPNLHRLIFDNGE